MYHMYTYIIKEMHVHIGYDLLDSSHESETLKNLPKNSICIYTYIYIYIHIYIYTNRV
jgi:hypothetical protein